MRIALSSPSFLEVILGQIDFFEAIQSIVNINDLMTSKVQGPKFFR
jgi:hypothetical protein